MGYTGLQCIKSVPITTAQYQIKKYSFFSAIQFSMARLVFDKIQYSETISSLGLEHVQHTVQWSSGCLKGSRFTPRSEILGVARNPNNHEISHLSVITWCYGHEFMITN